jgi:Ca2+-binding EF-hand superfamily protein
MSRLFAFLAAATLTSVGFAQVNSSTDVATGGMHFSAKAMDADHDGMISKDEFMKYHSDMWDKMTKDSNGSMSTADAATAFARGGMHVNVKAMDADHSGTISKDEFMSYEATHWNLLPKDASGQISVADMQKAMKKHRQQAAAASDSSDAPKTN